MPIKQHWLLNKTLLKSYRNKMIKANKVAGHPHFFPATRTSGNDCTINCTLHKPNIPKRTSLISYSTHPFPCRNRNVHLFPIAPSR